MELAVFGQITTTLWMQMMGKLSSSGENLA
jgi:hypothetical protein